MSSPDPQSQRRLLDKAKRAYDDPAATLVARLQLLPKVLTLTVITTPSQACKFHRRINMSDINPKQALVEEDNFLGDATYKASQFDDVIGHYEDAWEQYPDIAYKNNVATNRYQKEDYKGAIAASLSGIEDAAEETLTPAAVARALGRIGMCYTALGDMRKGLEYFEKSVEKHSTARIEKKLEKLKKEIDGDRELGDAVAETILKRFAKLPKKRKPLEGGGKKEWVPLAGIVAQGK